MPFSIPEWTKITNQNHNSPIWTVRGSRRCLNMGSTEESNFRQDIASSLSAASYYEGTRRKKDTPNSQHIIHQRPSVPRWYYQLERVYILQHTALHLCVLFFSSCRPCTAETQFWKIIYGCAREDSEKLGRHINSDMDLPFWLTHNHLLWVRFCIDLIFPWH